MPCAEAVAPALERRDLLLLSHARAENGILRLRLCGADSVIGEMDAITLFSVDHDSGAAVAPDGGGQIRTLGPLRPPVRAADRDGGDVLAPVRDDDGVCWDGSRRRRNPDSPDDLTDGLELEFTRPLGTRTARLVLDATLTAWAEDVLRSAVAVHGFETQPWLDAALADTARARRVREAFAGDAALRIFVWALDGWEAQGKVNAAGPGARRRTAVPLDLSRSAGGAVRVRLVETPGFWRVDRAAIDAAAESEALVQEQRPETARNARGRDVRGLLITEDRADYPLAPRDTVEIRFRAPKPLPGHERGYLARVTAWRRLLAPETAQPDRGTADRLESGAGALARFSVARMNAALPAADSSRAGP